MNRKDISELYDINSWGAISSPGKFEGEMAYAVYFWNLGLDGGADDEEYDEDSDTTAFGFKVSDADRLEFPELGNKKWVWLYETEQGFVTEVDPPASRPNPLTEDEAIHYAKRAVSFGKQALKKRDDYAYGKSMGLFEAPINDGPRSYRKRLASIRGRIIRRYAKPPYNEVYIEAARWFQKTYGNTYHAVRVYVNNELIGASGETYGYGEQYLQTAYDLLLKYAHFARGWSAEQLRQSHWDNRKKWNIQVRDYDLARDFKRFATQDRPK